MDLTGKKVLVAGCGTSGAAAAALLREKGSEVLLFEGNERVDVEKLRGKYPAFAGLPVFVGELPGEVLKELSLAVFSPGIPTDLPFAEAIREQGIPIWGEIELACRFAKGKVAAITGTNGKTTTTALTGEILKGCFSDVRVVGNIGIPYASVASETTERTVTVAEISSFQMETTDTFHPKVSAVLNITPDHLDRHHTMQRYIELKERITQNQTPSDLCVLNYEDRELREFGRRLSCRVLFFSSKRRLSSGIYLKGGVIWQEQDGHRRKIIDVSELQLLGLHNYENVMAAAGIALGMGASRTCIAEALREFRGVEHRIEFVRELRGVRFYNDSKATNPDAAIRGIRAMERDTLLIGGGYDKQNEFDEWIESFEGKVRRLVLIGQTREKIAACAARHGFSAVTLCGSLREAVDFCAGEARDGEAVLLSPACASWGDFVNYEERGKLFKQYVLGLE